MKRSWAVACTGCLVLFLSAARADDGVVLRHKSAKGDKIVFRSTTDTKQTQEIMGMKLENTVHQEQFVTSTVDSVDDAGNAQVTVKNERIKMSATFDALGEFKFDSASSERDKSSQIGAAVTPLLERLSGMSVQVAFTPRGEVTGVKGYADQLKDILEGNPLAAQFAGGGSDEAAKQSYQDATPNFPEKAVKPGDSWELPYSVDISRVGKMTGKRVFRYAGLDKVGNVETVKLEIGGDMKLELNIEMDGAKVTGTIASVSVTGTIQFDPALGRVVSSEGNATMNGTLNVAAGGQNIPVQNDQSVKTSYLLLEKLPE